MTSPVKKWEYKFMPVEFSDPYWDSQSGAPNVFLRGGQTPARLWIDDQGAEGWELVALLPTKSIVGMPETFRAVGHAQYPDLKWNVYFGVFRREVV